MWRRQLGNSVSPVIVAAVGAAIARALETARPSGGESASSDGQFTPSGVEFAPSDGESASSGRSDVAPALGLLLEATPRPDRPIGLEGLSLRQLQQRQNYESSCNSAKTCVMQGVYA
eukprot:215773-Prorocentrum_minimum.AAC.1